MKAQLMERSDISCVPEFDPTPRMYYVYILKNKKDNTLYYGYTNNLERRVEEHKKTCSCELVYYEAYKSEEDARFREKRLKHYAQALTALKGRLKLSVH